jgi:hypothetical protein
MNAIIRSIRLTFLWYFQAKEYKKNNPSQEVMFSPLGHFHPLRIWDVYKYCRAHNHIA